MSNDKLFDEMRALVEKAKAHKTCPSCGHCPTCGHTPQRLTPLYPWYPTYPIYPSGPYWQVTPTWTLTTRAGGYTSSQTFTSYTLGAGGGTCSA